MARIFLIPVFLSLGLVTASAQDGLLHEKLDFGHEGSLESGLTKLLLEADLPLIFSNDLVPQIEIHVDRREWRLDELLELMLGGSGLGYEELDGQIILLKVRPRLWTISGFVEDQASGERLIAASIFDQRSGRGTVSNNYGFFSLSLPEGQVSLAISYLGYTSNQMDLNLEEDVRINVQLETNLTLEEVVVTGVTEDYPGSGLMRGDQLANAALGKMPRLGGEADIIRLAQMLPGVQTGADGLGGLHVRGGDRGQNLVLVDGVPVYDLAHAGGLFSIFNTDAVRSATLIKGAFPARYGGRLSSVLDVRTREGHMKDWHGSAGMGLVSGKVSLEGPIVVDRMSVFASGRWSIMNWLINPASQRRKRELGMEGVMDYGFSDANLKLNYSFSEHDRIYASVYHGQDRYTNVGRRNDSLLVSDGQGGHDLYHYLQESSGRNEWNTTVAVLRWNHVLTPRVFSNLSLSYNRLHVSATYSEFDSLYMAGAQTDPVGNNFQNQFNSRIEDYALKSDWDWMPGAEHYVRFGGGATYHRFRPSLYRYQGALTEPQPGESDGNALLSTVEWWIYGEDEWQPHDQWTFNLGFRYAGWQARKRVFHAPEPRLAARYQANKRLQFSASFSMMSQFVHLLSNSTTGIPTDLWVPSTDATGFQQSLQTTIGSDWKIGRGFSFGMEGYYKQFLRLINLSDGASASADWEENLTSGTGRAWGLEFMLRKQAGDFQGWISYGLAWTDRAYQRVNFGNRFPFRYDRRHDIKLALQYQVTPWLGFSTNWMINSGLAFSIPTEQFVFQFPGLPPIGNPIIDSGTKNQFRMPWYHRLDVGINLTFQGPQELRHEIHAGLYNAYNRQNPLYFRLRSRVDVAEGQLVERKAFIQEALFPVLPTLSYTIRF